MPAPTRAAPVNSKVSQLRDGNTLFLCFEVEKYRRAGGTASTARLPDDNTNTHIP